MPGSSSAGSGSSSPGFSGSGRPVVFGSSWREEARERTARPRNLRAILLHPPLPTRLRSPAENAKPAHEQTPSTKAGPEQGSGGRVDTLERSETSVEWDVPFPRPCHCGTLDAPEYCLETFGMHLLVFFRSPIAPSAQWTTPPTPGPDPCD